MEIQVENRGSKIDLELFLYGFGSFISVYKFDFNFSVEGSVYMYIILFENHHMHPLFVFALLRD